MDRRVPNAERKHRLNREIMAPQVRLNGIENEPLGIVSLMDHTPGERQFRDLTQLRNYIIGKSATIPELFSGTHQCQGDS